MKLSVCIDAIFRGLPSAEAMRRVRGAGYDAYEFWGWWDKDLDAMIDAQRALGLIPAAMCTRFFSLADPAGHEDYLLGLEESIRAAKRLGCGTLISQCGQDTGMPWAAQRAAMIDGLRRAAPLAERAGIALVIEPLNRIDHPGYSLTTCDEAVEVLQAVDSPNVRMLFDLYHQQITEGDLIRRARRAMPFIGHFHAANNPGRGELGSGELDYRNIFAALDEAGYAGYAGLEYFPARPAEEGLREAKAMAQ